MKKIILSCITSTVILSGCTRMDSFQLGKVRGDLHKYQKFEIKVSATGFNVDQASKIAQLFTPKEANGAIKTAQMIIKMSQMGPKTGNPTFNDQWTNSVFNSIRRECPNGNITGLRSIREQKTYPIVSGEIVKITGYCQRKT